MDTKLDLQSFEESDLRLIEAFRGPDYEEVRTREVENGYIRPGDPNYPNPYPYRVPRDPYAYVKVANETGTVEIIACTEIEILRTKVDGDFLITHAEEKTLKIRIYPGTKYETGPSGARISTP